MKTRITIGAAMLLMLGSSLAGGMMYQKEKPSSAEFEGTVVSSDAPELTPDLIAKWKATAATTQYSPPMLPI